VPGLLTARLFDSGINVTVLVIALFSSYALYAFAAAIARVFGFGYTFVYLAFAGVSAILIAITIRRHSVSAERGPTSFSSIFVVGLAVILSTTYFHLPTLDDQGLLDLNILESRQNRSFAPSAGDVRPFGIEVPQPRMLANLYHAFFGLASEIVDVEPRFLTFVIANPFIGLFLFLAPTSFLWEMSRRRIDPIFCLVGVVAPVAFVFQAGNVYWYYFRLLNAPTVDKDFALFVLLPIMGLCGWRYLVDRSHTNRRWLTLIACSAPAAILSHPVTPIYLLLVWGALGLAVIRQDRFRRLTVLAMLGLFLNILSGIVINSAATHRFH